MDKVFMKTRELAQALMESEQYREMQQAQERCENNKRATALVEELVEKRGKLHQAMMSPAPDPVEMKRIADEIDLIEEQLDLFDEVASLNAARESFYKLGEQVNQVLQFIVTGNMDDPTEGCNGNCAGCGGCH